MSKRGYTTTCRGNCFDFGFRNCCVARFGHALKALKPLKLKTLKTFKHVLLKTQRPTLPVPPSPCPFHGFHATNCYLYYLCVYTPLLTRLPNGVGTAVCWLWFRSTLPARPCKSLALQLATIGFTGRPCPHYLKPSKSPLLFPAFFYTALPSEPCQTSFRGGRRHQGVSPLILPVLTRHTSWNDAWSLKAPLKALSQSTAAPFQHHGCVGKRPIDA